MDSYVLERKSLKNLKEDLYKMVVDYFNKIVCTNNSIIPYITQSWINYTEPNEFHHRHAHSNSYVSGVLYVVANKKVDKIRFWKSSFKVIDLTVAEYNIFNSDNWQYPVQTGDVVLFPSSLKHGVDKKEGTNIRTSLSFNVFFRGTIGNKFNLTELVLE